MSGPGRGWGWWRGGRLGRWSWSFCWAEVQETKGREQIIHIKRAIHVLAVCVL